MPIKHSVPTTPISDDDFHLLDYEVMGLVFAIHRDFGRFWNEKIYQNELAERCQKAGLGSIATEVPIQVSFRNFRKFYYIDLLINNVIYELKTAQTLIPEHQKQTINYLLLTGQNHAKLINMRPPSVQHRFVSTKITTKKRYDFTIDDEQWQDLNEESVRLKQTFKTLLEEWGAFLGVNLFYDAIVHFLGGEDVAIKEIEVVDGSRTLGKQRIHLINPEIAFKISTVTKDERYYEHHFSRFIRYTRLRAIQWINLNHNRIFFKTIL